MAEKIDEQAWTEGGAATQSPSVRNGEPLKG